MATFGHVRSISMPSRSHPLALQVEEQLQNLKASVASSSFTGQMMMCHGLQGLADLYNCIEELLHLPHNQQVLSQFQHRKLVDAELDGSLRLLDLCGALRDNLVSMKEHIQNLQLALRRRGDAAVQSKVHAYIRAGKKAQKGMKNILRSLKQLDSRCKLTSTTNMDSDLSMVIWIMKEARGITISLLKSILSTLFMAAPKPKASRWSFVSVALHKRKVACGEHEDTNEAVCEDFSFSSSYECIACKDAEGVKVQRAQEHLEAMEVSNEGLEAGLEGLFRRLVKNRVSLLNILSI